MKKIIFKNYKKLYEAKLEELEELENEMLSLTDENKNLKNDVQFYHNKNFELKEGCSDFVRTLQIKEIAIKELKEKIKSLQGQKGGLTKENNRLKIKVKELEKKLKDTEKKLAESMTDKFTVKKLKPQKVPKMQPAKIKSNAVQSKIIKQIKEM